MSLSSDINTISSALTAIKNAIIAKGVTPSGNITTYASAIGNIPSGGGSTLITKNITQNGTYNASTDNADGYSSVTVNVSGGAPQNIPMEIDDGMLQRPQTSFVYTMPSSVTGINDRALLSAFRGSAVSEVEFSPNLLEIQGEEACIDMCNECQNLTNFILGGASGFSITGVCAFQGAFAYSTLVSFDASNVEIISGDYAIAGACAECTELDSFCFPSLVSIYGDNSFDGCCVGCVNLVDVDFTGLVNIGNNLAPANQTFNMAFQGCESLESISFDFLEELYGNAIFEQAFTGCTSLQEITFPSLTTITFTDTDPFSYMLLDCEDVTVHFPSALEATIGNYASVLDGFGGTNTTVLFDL